MLLTFLNEVKEIYTNLISEDNLFGDNQYIKYALVGFIILSFIAISFVILFNSIIGINNIYFEIFQLNSYKFIKYLNIDIQSNLKKKYIPELVISIIFLFVCIFLVYYINTQIK